MHQINYHTRYIPEKITIKLCQYHGIFTNAVICIIIEHAGNACWATVSLHICIIYTTYKCGSRIALYTTYMHLFMRGRNKTQLRYVLCRMYLRLKCLLFCMQY